jgi:CARDB
MSLPTSMAETLESRVLFAGVPMAAAVADPGGPPDLAAVSMVAKLPAAAVPGTKVKTRVQVLNNGGGMAAPTSVAVGVYATEFEAPAPGEVPFAVVPVRMRLRAQQAKFFKVQFALPQSLPSSTYHLVVQVNVDNAVIETNIDNNVVASSFLSNPIGHYEGQVTVDGEDPIPIAFDILAAALGRVRSTIFGGGDSNDLFSLLNITDASATLTPTGRYKVRARGSFNGEDSFVGSFSFSISANGQISGQTMAGTLSIRAKLDTGQSVGGRANFFVTKVA